MNRIKDYEKLKFDIDRWLKDYYYFHAIKSFVVGVSGGIDSAVVSTLCAETGLPTYILTMPLHSKEGNTELSDLHAYQLVEKYPNVTIVNVDLSKTYDAFMDTVYEGFTINPLANANTKSRLRMVTLYQIAGSVGGIVVGTGNKVEDYGIGFYTKYGDGGVDIAPIADLYKTEVWELGKRLGVDERIINALPTDGLWDDDRKDEDQIGASYEQLEEAMEYRRGPALDILDEFNRKNKHKMEPIPTFKLEKLS
jgi:NAD+ synthase